MDNTTSRQTWLKLFRKISFMSIASFAHLLYTTSSASVNGHSSCCCYYYYYHYHY